MNDALGQLFDCLSGAHEAWAPAVRLILRPTLAAYLIALAAIRIREVARARGEEAPES